MAQHLQCLTFYHPEMQEALLAAAERAGAEVRRGASVQEVRLGASPSVVAQRNGHTEEIRARMIVGSDGRSSIASRSAGFETKRDADRMLLAGVLLENCPAPEDTAQIVIDSNTGSSAVVFPQGGGRARAYFAYHKDSRPRIQGDAAFSDFIESCQRAGANPVWYDGATAAGPLASFDGADTDTSHPYRNRVALVGDAAATSDPTWARVCRQHCGTHGCCVTSCSPTRIGTRQDMPIPKSTTDSAGPFTMSLDGIQTSSSRPGGKRTLAGHGRSHSLHRTQCGNPICCFQGQTCLSMMELAAGFSERTEGAGAAKRWLQQEPQHAEWSEP
jgi:hypothetical protein